MIIKTSYFKKLIKQAYKCGKLIVGNTGTDYIISGGYWVLTIDNEALTKEEKGILISFADDLQEQGIFYEIEKGSRQVMLPESLQYCLESKQYCKNAVLPAKKTIVSLEGIYRVFKDKYENVYMFSEEFLDSIGASNMNSLANEKTMEGPFIGDGGTMVFRTTRSTLELCRIRLDEEKEIVLDGLKGLFLGEEKNA